jgi:hypothetical protein
MMIGMLIIMAKTNVNVGQNDQHFESNPAHMHRSVIFMHERIIVLFWVSKPV